MARRASRTTFNFHEASARGTLFKGRRGFTIVELLIVIVVIAILAAITIVAYNGIQNRAKASAAQAAAKQAFTKIQTFAVSNADTYPADLAAAGLSNSDGTSYQYRVDNGSNPRTFCLTATSSNVSYYVSNSTSSPTTGACPGHGVNGGTTVTNLLTNPSVEAGISTWTAPFGAWNSVAQAPTGQVGGSSARFYRTAAATDARMARHSLPPLAVGSYVYSAWVFVADSAIGSVSPSLVFNGSTGTVGAVTSTSGASSQWRRVTVAFTVNTQGGAYVDFIGGANQIGSIFLDAAMLTQGTSLYEYADGDSSGWTWNGTPNNSTSTGPPL